MADDSGEITSPEGVLMLMVAVILDGIGLIILCFALDDFWILDMTGLLTIGAWIFFRTGHVSATATAKKTGKKLLSRLGLGLIVELIPWFGGLCPSWVIIVWREMNGKNVKDTKIQSQEIQMSSNRELRKAGINELRPNWKNKQKNENNSPELESEEPDEEY
ncbi:MAG: hypothetical protein A2312_04005 [Candidatus Staskawiczbacteria bacterium RIFOXYB2_FULL_32_9]|uniref:Uncharacterized protein n=1 Tax=Candidatus Staskawiczbacteria bacterium RIFOXYD1_FULL_32_13 TaxID=1802234 RepID=A0A1G2JQP2_9BACT|nr:MAG: hypothetical protein UR22_C0008G0055 [Parcubacteria group bacterium GW2011_GWC2_32_10]OGZ78079.1 MAG: hypothetical protein A2256_01960 [Candidatus Staskawiczbacteria bacterium RIFOXYA2_FULL_32_7]OGZ78941.1 MAG: hypothetical protein A2360_01820 [Candidatus Staskawiczbacteria bacterium RIFOXYB1_FULL_32_11]OGZ83127.1 MAG: hypothetical protein A2312_04005 [Candidatus Staskawiczbacteria bacterium RIFOXYB2_FULL_32_9]OGZ85803.1 MAG: hypothetical protein A2463_04015 [Candidatus Staskawiczbacter